jgi:hypothetical protein
MFAFRAALAERCGDVVRFDLGCSPCILVNGAREVHVPVALLSVRRRPAHLVASQLTLPLMVLIGRLTALRLQLFPTRDESTDFRARVRTPAKPSD